MSFKTKLYKMSRNFSLSGNMDLPKQVSSRYSFFNWNAVLTILVAIITAISYQLLLDKADAAIILYSLSVAYIGLIFIARMNRGFRVSVYLTIVIYLGFMTYNMIYNDDNGMRIAWYAFAILYSYFLVGIRSGMFFYVVSSLFVIFLVNSGLTILNDITFYSGLMFLFIINAFSYWLEQRFEGDAKKLLDIDTTIDMIVANSTNGIMMKLRDAEIALAKMKKVKKK